MYLLTQFCLSTRFALAPTLVWLCYLPEVVALRGKKPSSFVNSSFGRFRLSLAISSFEVGSRLREVVDFLVLCINLHLVPFEHFPVWENSSHSKICFLLHWKKKNIQVYISAHEALQFVSSLFYLTFCPSEQKPFKKSSQTSAFLLTLTWEYGQLSLEHFPQRKNWQTGIWKDKEW